jgi:uncharacterized membrane protein YdjX (TVP38/TMEM64 family)
MDTPPHEVMSQRRRAAFLALVVVALVAITASDSLHTLISQALERSEHVIGEHRAAGIAVFLVLSAVSAMMVFFSTAILVPIAIYAWGRPATLLLLWIGWLIGGITSYVIGRYPGRRVLRWLVPRKEVERFEGQLSSTASLPLVLLFQLALPSEIPGYILGTVKYRLWKYLVALAIAEFPFAIGAVYLGESFLRRDYMLLVIIAAGGALLSIAALHVLHRVLAARSAR